MAGGIYVVYISNRDEAIFVQTPGEGDVHFLGGNDDQYCMVKKDKPTDAKPLGKIEISEYNKGELHWVLRDMTNNLVPGTSRKTWASDCIRELRGQGILMN